MPGFVRILIGAALGGIVFQTAFPRVPGWLFGLTLGVVGCQLSLVWRRLSQIERQLGALSKGLPPGELEESSRAAAEAKPDMAAAAVEDFLFKPAQVAKNLDQPEALGLDQDWRRIPSPSKEEPPGRGEPAPSFWGMLPDWITGGNLLVKLGVVILFFGVAFLVKFASEYGLLPIELRLAFIAFGSVALLAAGWRLRKKRLRYALALQGGGVGVLYLTIFAALRLYHLLPAGFAFPLLVFICAISAFLAVIQDSRALAVLGSSGGFLAPVLASTGSGSHVALFSYYALLNGGIIGIAWYRSWRLLNLVGFFFTFIITAIWGAQYYRPVHFATTEPFLILFGVMFVAAAILFARRQPPELQGYVDGTLVFGTPIVAFALQAQLVKPNPWGLAWSAVGFGVFYLACAGFVFVWLGRMARLLAEAFLAFSVIFGTLAIPLAMDGRWTAATWAAEGAAMVWIGVRQRRIPARAFGMLLQFGAGFFFFSDFSHPSGTIPILNGFYLGCFLISGAALLSSWYLHRHWNDIRKWEQSFAVILFAWGMIWWFGGGALEVQRHVSPVFLQGGLLLFAALSAALCCSLEGRLSWSLLSWSALGLLPLSALLFLSGSLRLPHPFAQGGIIGWPVALVLLYRILFRQDHFRADLLRPLHAAALWLATAVITFESAWRIDRLIDGAGVWPLIAWGIVPALVVLSLTTLGRRLEWPLQRYSHLYLTLGIGPIAFFAWMWAGYANLVSSGEPWPVAYAPLFNPLDIAIGLVACGLWTWQALIFRGEGILGIRRSHFLAAFAFTLFFWFNGMLVRTVHHWGGVPFEFTAMSRSILLQTSFSIAWSLIALCVMVIATRRRVRLTWMIGAALLTVVVGKLFLVDLSGTGTIERIISFVGVGLLLLLIGWFSPVPPGDEREPA